MKDRARGRETHRACTGGRFCQASHLGDILGRRVLVPDCSVAHDLKAKCAVRKLRTEIDRVFSITDPVEVLLEALPLTPGHAFGECRPRNVLDAFHDIHQRLFLALRTRREADTTIAHDHRGHAIAERRVERVVPSDLPVVVRVHVDPSRGNDRAIGLDDLGIGCVDSSADPDDDVARDGEVARDGRCAGPVDERAPTNKNVDFARCVL